MIKDRGDEPKSLLRRLLDKADKLEKPAEAPATVPLSTPGIPAPPSSSPIRPQAPASTPAPAAIEPTPPRQKAFMPTTITSTEDRLQAETALLQLRQKTVQVANEFAAGRMNRVQFSSLYTHYNEKVIIIERMLARDPNSQAWQSVARPGHTTFLKQHYEARALAFGVYDYGKTEAITIQGSTAMPTPMITQILQALEVIRQTRRDLKPLSRKIGSGSWLVVIPGNYTVALVLYSLEPATYQIKIARDLQFDFERANRHALERGIRQPDQLVFPHRALLELHPEG